MALRTARPRIATADQRTAREPPKVAHDHYASPEHKAWRAAVIARAGGRCQGAVCEKAHRTGYRLFADHITELRDGGAALDPANGMALCGACHTTKTIAARAKRMAARHPRA